MSEGENAAAEPVAETAGMSLAGKSALVTGAGKRIGRAIALALAREGANVAVNYRSSEREAAELVAELNAIGAAHGGAGSVSLQADLANQDELHSLVDRARQSLGGAPLEILVNNAAIFPQDSFAELDLAGIEENIEINAWAPLVLMRAFAAQTQRGHVVNLIDSRVWGFDRTHVAYILSKHVLNALTRLAALELAPGIAVNGISPGLILPPPDKDETYVERLTGTVPLKRRGHPDDIAAAAIYLVKSEFVTGEVLFVDGGRHLKEFPA